MLYVVFFESEPVCVYQRSVKDLECITSYYEQKIDKKLHEFEQELVKPIPDSTRFALKEMLMNKCLDLHDNVKPADSYHYYIIYVAKHEKQYDENEYQLLSFFMETSL